MANEVSEELFHIDKTGSNSGIVTTKDLMQGMNAVSHRHYHTGNTDFSIKVIVDVHEERRRLTVPLIIDSSLIVIVFYSWNENDIGFGKETLLMYSSKAGTLVFVAS